MKHLNKNKLFKKFKKGFTLIELLVAIAIIGILSALILTNLQDARARARDIQRKSDLKQLKTSLRMYYNDYQEYPGESSRQIYACLPPVLKAWGNAFSCGTTVYMKKLPEDPLSTQSYEYDNINDDSYYLYACLENESDTSGSASCGSLSCSTSWCFQVSED